jgi:hypothetical protein
VKVPQASGAWRRWPVASSFIVEVLRYIKNCRIIGTIGKSMQLSFLYPLPLINNVFCLFIALCPLYFQKYYNTVFYQ